MKYSILSVLKIYGCVLIQKGFTFFFSRNGLEPASICLIWVLSHLIFLSKLKWKELKLQSKACSNYGFTAWMNWTREHTSLKTIATKAGKNFGRAEFLDIVFRILSYTLILNWVPGCCNSSYLSQSQLVLSLPQLLNSLQIFWDLGNCCCGWSSFSPYLLSQAFCTSVSSALKLCGLAACLKLRSCSEKSLLHIFFYSFSFFFPSYPHDLLLSNFCQHTTLSRKWTQQGKNLCGKTR